MACGVRGFTIWASRIAQSHLPRVSVETWCMSAQPPPFTTERQGRAPGLHTVLTRCRARGLTKQRRVSRSSGRLSVRRGEILFIWSNGSGKSTTVTLSVGLISQRGSLCSTVALADDAFATSAASGYVPEEPHFYTI